MKEKKSGLLMSPIPFLDYMVTELTELPCIHNRILDGSDHTIRILGRVILYL
jgi:hypothetical protein